MVHIHIWIFCNNLKIMVLKMYYKLIIYKENLLIFAYHNGMHNNFPIMIIVN